VHTFVRKIKITRGYSKRSPQGQAMGGLLPAFAKNLKALIKQKIR
jgi:hypothetical protein